MKKVLVRRYDRETRPGWINTASFLQPGGVELMSKDGGIEMLPYRDVKGIYFVRDWEDGLPERQTFQTRPKTPGLWINLRFRDGDVMEGVIPNDLMSLEAGGFSLLPPDPFSNTQRIFVPRLALVGVEVLGVVGSPLRKRKPAKGAVDDGPTLFDQPPDTIEP